jgi:hypothetical protein
MNGGTLSTALCAAVSLGAITAAPAGANRGETYLAPAAR